jgi:hypothetical protein
VQKRLLLNLLKIIGLLWVVSVEWRSGQSSFANSTGRNPEASTTPRSLRSLDPTPPKKLIANLTGASKQTTEEKSERYKLCDDRSDAYLNLPLQEVDPIFRLCASELLKRTKVPIVLPPTTLIKSFGRLPYVYLYIPSTNADRYLIGLTWKLRNYYHANAAYFEGKKLTAESPTLLEAHEKASAWARRYPFTDKRELGSVSLSQAIEGYYTPFACGANCNAAYSSVIWDQQGYRYRMAIKMGKKSEVLELVNAAIENQRISPSEPEDNYEQPCQS